MEWPRNNVKIEYTFKAMNLINTGHSPYALARIGTDFVNDQSTYLVGAFIEEYIYLKKPRLVSDYTTTFGIKCGLIF